VGRSRTQRHLVTRVIGDAAPARRPDALIVEEPLTIQLDGVTVATTMRTPGHDFELAAGWCHTEGLLAGAPVDEVRYCGLGSALATEFNVVSVSSGGRAPTPVPRLTATTSSCGWCGRDQLDDMVARLAPLPAGTAVLPDLYRALPGLVSPHQELFGGTGAAHAAAAFTPGGDIVHVREDVGRHNAVDKVVGALLLADRLPAAGLGLFVSSRASVEIVQKAWAAGFATVVAVSAPTALAVDAARRANLVLAGFVRGDSVNVYSPERID